MDLKRVNNHILKAVINDTIEQDYKRLAGLGIGVRFLKKNRHLAD